MFDQTKDFYILNENSNNATNFLYTFKGLGDAVFSKLEVSLKGQKAIIDTAYGMPHSYFSDVYASIEIKDKDGVKKYKREYKGNQTNSAKKDSVDLKSGDYITVYHREYKNRLIIENMDINEQLATTQTITYRVTETGLEAI